MTHPPFLDDLFDGVTVERFFIQQAEDGCFTLAYLRIRIFHCYNILNVEYLNETLPVFPLCFELGSCSGVNDQF